ncbi:MAG: tetratricopeptide repeat protein [Sedimentisphaerales bacterium]
MKLNRIMRLSFVLLILVIAISVNQSVNGKTPDFNDILKSAEQGDPNAQFKLGDMYWIGKEVPHNFQQALKWYEKAAEQGHSEAQYTCGLIYLYGNKETGFPKNYQQAIKWFVKASEQKYFWASFQLGEIYEEGNAVPQNYRQAVKWFLKAAEEGDYGESSVRIHLRIMYDEGKCELQDYEKVIKLIQKKAERGNESAQFELANMYLHGDILDPSSKPLLITQDYQQAISWFLKLAERDVPFARSAQCQLGRIYSEGVGVPQDYVEAYKWLILSALEPDESLAKYYVEARDALRLKMSPQQIIEAQQLAKEFRPKIGNNTIRDSTTKPKQGDKTTPSDTNNNKGSQP